MIFVALVLATGVGCLLAILGSGGSIVALPILVYVARIPVAEAVPMSLVVVGSGAWAGALMRRRASPFHLRAAALFSGSGLPGAWLGSRFTHLLPGSAVMLVFAVVLAAAAVALLRGRSDRAPKERCDVARCLGVGAALGVLTGFLGVGGGFLIFPALILFAGIAPDTAVSTSLVVIGANSFSGLISHLGNVALDWRLTAGFAVSALAGMAIGTRIASRISPRALRAAFAYAVLAMAALILAASAWEILTGAPQHAA